MPKLKSILTDIQTRLSPVSNFFSRLYRQKDKLWGLLWAAGLLVVVLWDALYLNTPSFNLVLQAFLNTFFTAMLVILFTVTGGWLVGTGLFFLEENNKRTPYLAVTFILNIIRSVPQIIGILFGYVILTFLILNGWLTSSFWQLVFIALVVSVFVFLEVADLVRDRINYYRKLDFFPAMLCCGIKKSRIVNIEILWKNSTAFIFHKLISVFGITIFLLCSIDFVISVGLSTDVSLTNFPVTLGSMLATLDSKQDILAISTLFGDPFYFPQLFFRHLQGISLAFVIVFSLLSIYKISNGFIERKNLYTKQ